MILYIWFMYIFMKLHNIIEKLTNITPCVFQFFCEHQNVTRSQEFPGLLWASSAATGACEAAARVRCSRNYRTLPRPETLIWAIPLSCPSWLWLIEGMLTVANLWLLLWFRYVSLMLAGLCYLFDEPVPQGVKSWPKKFGVESDFLQVGCDTADQGIGDSRSKWYHFLCSLCRAGNLRELFCDFGHVAVVARDVATRIECVKDWEVFGSFRSSG